MIAASSSVGATDVLVLALAICVAMAVSVAIYHAMQRPRLRLTQMPDGTWRAKRRDVVQYLVTIPFLMTLWVLWLAVILVVGVNYLTGARIVEVACAVVLATRTLAHIRPEPAHELAKNIPLTLVTLVIVSGAVRNTDSLVSFLEGIETTTITTQVSVVLFAGDVALTAAWYWIGVRWLAPRGWSVPGQPVTP